MEITERGIPGKRDDQGSRNKRLYMRKIGSVTCILMSREAEVGPVFKPTAEASAEEE